MLYSPSLINLPKQQALPDVCQFSSLAWSPLPKLSSYSSSPKYLSSDLPNGTSLQPGFLWLHQSLHQCCYRIRSGGIEPMKYPRVKTVSSRVLRGSAEQTQISGVKKQEPFLPIRVQHGLKQMIATYKLIIRHGYVPGSHLSTTWCLGAFVQFKGKPLATEL